MSNWSLKTKVALKAHLKFLVWETPHKEFSRWIVQNFGSIAHSCSPSTGYHGYLRNGGLESNHFDCLVERENWYVLVATTRNSIKPKPAPTKSPKQVRSVLACQAATMMSSDTSGPVPLPQHLADLRLEFSLHSA